MNKTMKREFLEMFTEIEFNTEDDSLYERIVLTRLRDYADKHFGTHLNDEMLKECAGLREALDKGETIENWKKKIRIKRIKMIKEM